nr:hypothetical protein [Tanacetum cinerariifolium]
PGTRPTRLRPLELPGGRALASECCAAGRGGGGIPRG